MTTTTIPTVPATIVAQVPGWLKACVGWRNLRFDDTSIMVDVRGRCSKTVDVAYLAGPDLYRVRVWNKGRTATPKLDVEVDVAGMVAVFDSIDRGAL